jgi:hypothetical protein
LTAGAKAFALMNFALTTVALKHFFRNANLTSEPRLFQPSPVL